jgi:hypothetical protein
MKWYGTKHAAQILWEQRRFAPTVHITPDEIAKDDPILAEVIGMLDKYPKKLIRWWEATPVEIRTQSVDAFNTMLVEPEKYMELLEGIEKVAKETWPDYGVNY